MRLKCNSRLYNLSYSHFSLFCISCNRLTIADPVLNPKPFYAKFKSLILDPYAAASIKFTAL